MNKPIGLAFHAVSRFFLFPLSSRCVKMFFPCFRGVRCDAGWTSCFCIYLYSEKRFKLFVPCLKLLQCSFGYSVYASTLNFFFFLNNIATAVFMGPHSCAQVCAWADECRLSSKTWTKLSDFPLWECIKRTFFCCCCLFLRFLLVNLWFVRGACSYVLCLASVLCVVFPLMCYVTRARMIRTKCMPLWCLTHLRRAYALSLRHTLSVIRTLRCAPFSCHLKQR